MIRKAAVASACLVGLAAPAFAGDLREMMRQPGEWEMSMSGGMMPAMTQRGCYSGGHSVTELVNKGMRNCSQTAVNLGGSFGTVDAVCQMQGIHVTVHSTITPTGDAAFHSDSHVHMEGMPAIKGIPSDMTMSVDGHRTGPCQPGDKQY
jgi:hypothetical protein